MKTPARVRIIEEATGEITWRGPLLEFFRANKPSRGERAFICGVLRAGERIYYGGGAAAAFIIENDKEARHGL